MSSTGWKDGGVEVLTGTHMLQDAELRVFRGRVPQTHLGYSDLFPSLKAIAQEEGTLKCDDPPGALSEISPFLSHFISPPGVGAQPRSWGRKAVRPQRGPGPGWGRGGGCPGPGEISLGVSPPGRCPVCAPLPCGPACSSEGLSAVCLGSSQLFTVQELSFP